MTYGRELTDKEKQILMKAGMTKQKTWVNPFTGKPRCYLDVLCDPAGALVRDEPSRSFLISLPS